MRLRPVSRAFTLIELIVVIVILGILAALAVPSFRSTGELSETKVNESSLRAFSRQVQALAALNRTAPIGDAARQALQDMPPARPGQLRYLAPDGSSLSIVSRTAPCRRISLSATVAGQISDCSSYAREVLADNPIGFWRLGEQAGATSAANSSGAAASGVLSVPFVSAGSQITNDANGAWRSYTSTGSQIRLTGLPVDTSAGACTTVELWMTWTGTNTRMPFGWQLYDLYLWNGAVGFNTGNSDVYGLSSVGLAGVRTHVAAVFCNGGVTSNKIYLNGVPQTLSQQHGTPSGANAQVTANAYISGWGTNTGYNFDGVLDDVSIYNGELPAARVLAHYNAGA